MNRSPDPQLEEFRRRLARQDYFYEVILSRLGWLGLLLLVAALIVANSLTGP